MLRLIMSAFLLIVEGPDPAWCCGCSFYGMSQKEGFKKSSLVSRLQMNLKRGKSSREEGLGLRGSLQLSCSPATLTVWVF